MNFSRAGFLWVAGWVVFGLSLSVGCQQAAGPGNEGEPAASGSTAPGATPSAGESGARATAAKPDTTPPAAPRTVTLAAGTLLKVRTTTTLSTETHAAGQTFVAHLEEPLQQGDWLIAPKGATVEGRIVAADKGGRVQGVASLSVALSRFETADGQMVDLATNTISIEAATTKAKDATKIGIGAGIGAAVGAIAGGGKGAGIGAATGAGAGTAAVLATRGDPAEIQSETVLNFELRSPVTVTEQR